MSKPMTDADLDRIERHAALVYDGYNGSDLLDLVREVRRLTAGIRTKAEAWVDVAVGRRGGRWHPDALAFRVTADFRTLIGDDDE